MARSPEALCIEVRLEAAAAAEWAAAEAWEAGALGVEERSSPSGDTLLLLYTAAETADAVRQAVAEVPGALFGETRAVVETDWSQEWRKGLEAVRVGKRLVVRPSWIDVALGRDQVEVVIDPGQAFGTGGHVSTRLALEWIEAIACTGAFEPGHRALDVGAGTGVLALAALKLGVGTALGFDLDPLSGEACREWAERNGLGDRMTAFVGPIDAISEGEFDWVFANLLKREMLPIASEIAAATRAGGHAVFSGLLASEREEVEARLAAAGFGATRARAAVDPNGDEWISLLMRRGS